VCVCFCACVCVSKLMCVRAYVRASACMFIYSKFNSHKIKTDSSVVCRNSSDPANPANPADPDDPADPANPADPADPDDPADSD
jgi:hypothetical protein